MLCPAIEKDESADGIPAPLTSVDWITPEFLEPVLQDFMEVQKELEGAKYVMGSLVVGTIYDLRRGLETAIGNLQLPSPQEDIDQVHLVEIRRTVQPASQKL